jgi:predicted sulfurtransferase
MSCSQCGFYGSKVLSSYRGYQRLLSSATSSSSSRTFSFPSSSFSSSRAALLSKRMGACGSKHQHDRRTVAAAAASDKNGFEEEETSNKNNTHQLVTFFKFTVLPNAEEEVNAHREFIEANNLEIRGRIYLNEQGVNAQMSGKGTDGETYARWVEKRTPFNGMRISVYPYHEHGHPDLRLRVKPQLVQLENGTTHLPIADKSKRGTSLSPEEWHEMIERANEDPNDKENPLLLDVRNGYEWDVGHFKGAQRPVQESFRETVETNVDDKIGPLADMPKDKPIMMYCTGGIRCDVYSTVLKEQGYKNVMVLEGGVQAYFEKYGNKEKHAWDDHLFVFDNRLAMTPQGTPAATLGDKAATLECHVCKQKNAPPPHRNCPNVDCNRLFLVCKGCSEKLDGFCCQECTQATHVRPQLVNPGRYKKYASYDTPEARAARRGDGRHRRKQLRLMKRKLACAEYVIRTVLGDEEAASSSNESSSGTFAARTRSNNKVGESDDDDDDDGEEEEEEEPEEWDENGKGKKIKPQNSKYLRLRMRLEEAIPFVQGDMSPEKLVRAMETLNAERVGRKSAPEREKSLEESRG